MAGKVTIETVDQALRSLKQDSESGSTKGSRAADAALAKRLLPLIAKLDARKQQVIVGRYGLNGDKPKTLQAIGDTLDRTRERVRQIQNLALARLVDLLAEA